MIKQDVILADAIFTLAERTGFPSVSLYLPTHRTGAELRQGPIRLKNLLRKAKEGLEARGMSSREIDALFKNVQQHTLNETDPFWQHRDHGLAVFISQEGTRYVDAPLHFDERVKVGRRFLVKPILPMLMRDSRFYVLEASLDHVVLHRATRFSMSAVDDERLSTASLHLGFTEPVSQETTIQEIDSDALASTEGLPPRGARQEPEKFALSAAKAAGAMLADADEPLVLAADDRMLGMLRQHLRYNGLVEEGIREHPRSLDAAELHKRAYALVERQLDQTRLDAIKRFEGRVHDASDAGASSLIQDIIPAACQGRVEALVVSIDAVIPGVFIPEQNQAVVAREETDETMDLVDFAIVQTLRHGGKIYSQPADRNDLPAIGAIFRY
jgi:protein required for attachment to host cells